jgi:hypothetical protein
VIAVLADADGALIAWAPTVAALPPASSRSIVRELAEWNAPPSPPYAWSASAINWVLSTVTTPRLSRLAFRTRYTLAEQIAITRAETEAPDPDMRATLTILRQSLSDATDVDVTDPRTVMAVNYYATVGLLAPSRVAEILATP